MQSNTIRRSAGQALFSYLPENVVESKSGRVVTRVIEWIPRPINPEGEERILEKIYANFGAYKSLDNKFPSKPNVLSFEFYEPMHITVELFPLTFYNKEDRTFIELTSVGEVKTFLASESKKGQADKWVQSDLVYINPETGNMKSFHIIPCPNHKKNRYMQLVNSDKSQRYWLWRCKECGHESKVFGYVDNKQIYTATPANSPQVFQPQIASVINVRDYAKFRCGKDKAGLVVASKYLNLVNNSLGELFDEAGSLGRQGPTSKEIEVTTQNIAKKLNLSAEQVRGIIGMYDESRNETGLETRLRETGGLLSGIANIDRVLFDLYEYMEALEEDTVKTLDGLILNARQEKKQFIQFKEKLSGLGVTNSYALQKIPLIQVAYGYIRGNLDPAECKLRAFPFQGHSNTLPLYAHDTKTEALIFEFDRDKIGKWLVANGLISTWEANGEVEKKIWFLKNINPELVTRFSGVADQSVTMHVFKLLHSISHALIKQIPQYAGISSSSVGEIILPNIPAIIIFSNSEGGFNIGELNDLYENRVYPWVDMAKGACTNGGCVYDPVCFEGEGSCHYCMFLHEVTCSYFNKELGRDYLFNGGSGLIKYGFWEKQK